MLKANIENDKNWYNINLYDDEICKNQENNLIDVNNKFTDNFWKCYNDFEYAYGLDDNYI